MLFKGLGCSRGERNGCLASGQKDSDGWAPAGKSSPGKKWKKVQKEGRSKKVPAGRPARPPAAPSNPADVEERAFRMRARHAIAAVALLVTLLAPHAAAKIFDGKAQLGSENTEQYLGKFAFSSGIIGAFLFCRTARSKQANSACRTVITRFKPILSLFLPSYPAFSPVLHPLRFRIW